uniref:Nuclear valosin-containing protein-like n=1 Tax=Dermatophagoides pteronyssinus TaxID=6956 RepID=A0A6P6YJP0_DERPT|nr:nuclear valosin-containing protein-like [Dermatophagoides pteronyssinus]
MKSWFEKSVRFFVSALVWVSRVEVRFLVETDPEAGARKKGNAEKGLFAKHVVLVSSCKGGVGKSTLSVNLAYILKARGCAVAICDLDVYGPSFSVLLPLQSVNIEQKVYFEKDAGESDNKMVPLEYGGVKLMSASYILAPEQFNGVRGAMAARLCNELLFNVRYGPLDYLIVDTPPGTGDVHISLVEELEVDGVLVVSNPAELSYADVQRGIRFYETFSVPILGVILPSVTLEDVGGLASVKKFLAEQFIDPILHLSEYVAAGLPDASGVLLHGPPGCGKTHLAKAIANACGSRFMLVNGSELLGRYVGESEERVKQLFEKARVYAPCLIFFDEFDALCPSRANADTHEVSKRVVNLLLTELDGVRRRPGVFVVGATNQPSLIDEAVLRAGRFEHKIFIGLPDATEREDIVKRTGAACL